LLLLDDCDSGTEIRADLSAWESKLAPEAIVLLHGIGLEREDSPKAAWEDWSAKRLSAAFPEGLGVSIALQSETKTPSSFLLKEIFGPPSKVEEIRELYALAAARLDAFGR